MSFPMCVGVFGGSAGWGDNAGMCEVWVNSKIITYKVGLGRAIHIRWRVGLDIPWLVLWALAPLLLIIRGNL